MGNYRVISSDSHVFEPPDLWTSRIGVDNLMWGSDYPHPECTFPRSRQVLEEVLAECTEEEKAKIAGGNAARVYHFD